MPLKPQTMEAVSRGVQLLNTVCPGWQARIRWEDLDMSSIFEDVLGQIYGSNSIGIDRLEHWLAKDLGVDPEEVILTPGKFGFSSNGEFRTSYDELTIAWTELGHL